MMKFLSLKELHRLPLLPQDQTSVGLRYLTATTTAAQRLRAVGQRGPEAAAGVDQTRSFTPAPKSIRSSQ
jgi:hypothetical protein